MFPRVQAILQVQLGIGLLDGMSAGYADKLSYRDDLGGQLGAPELQDEDGVLDRKISELATMVSLCDTCVAPIRFTFR